MTWTPVTASTQWADNVLIGGTFDGVFNYCVWPESWSVQHCTDLGWKWSMAVIPPQV